MSEINPSKLQIIRKKSLFAASLTILLVVIGSFSFSAYFKASGYEAKEEKKVTAPTDFAKGKAVSSCCSQPNAASESYTLVGSYYSLKENQETTLMFNNKGPEPLIVSPTFFSLSGERLEIPDITIPATSYQEVDLRELLAGHFPQFEEGSLQVTHHGMRLQLGAQFKMTPLMHSQEKPKSKVLNKEVTQLLEIIKNRNLVTESPDKLAQAIEALGQRRITEAIPDLIEYLDFRRIHKWEGTGVILHPLPKEGDYPAVGALFSMGKPALPVLIKVVEENDIDSIKSKNALKTS
jgi:hypothetical protein